MGASVGTKTYNAVTWASGDFMTEAKLDLMVDNDQAYDSHGAQGMIMDNEKSFGAESAGGVKLNVARINATDQLEIGDAALTGNPPILFKVDNWLRQADFDSTTLPVQSDSLAGGDFTTANLALTDTGVTFDIISAVDGILIIWASVSCQNSGAGNGVHIAIGIGGTDHGEVRGKQDTADQDFNLATVAIKTVANTTTTVKLRAGATGGGTARLIDAEAHLVGIFIPYSGI